MENNKNIKKIEQELNIIFNELFEDGIIATYIVAEDSVEFSFNTTYDSPHNIYVESDDDISIMLYVEGTGYEDDRIITITVSNILDIKNILVKQKQFYINALDL